MSILDLSDELILKCFYPENSNALSQINNRFRNIARSVSYWNIKGASDVALIINLKINRILTLVVPEYVISACNFNIFKLISVHTLVVDMCSIGYALLIKHEHLLLKCSFYHLLPNIHIIMISLNSTFSVQGSFAVNHEDTLWLQKRSINNYLIVNSEETIIVDSTETIEWMLKAPLTIYQDSRDITDITMKRWSEYQGLDVSNHDLWIFSIIAKECVILLNNDILTTKARSIFIKTKSPHKCLYAEIIYTDALEFLEELILPNAKTIYVVSFKFISQYDINRVRKKHPMATIVESMSFV